MPSDVKQMVPNSPKKIYASFPRNRTICNKLNLILTTTIGSFQKTFLALIVAEKHKAAVLINLVSSLWKA